MNNIKEIVIHSGMSDGFTPIEEIYIEAKSIEVRLKNPTELNLNK